MKKLLTLLGIVLVLGAFAIPVLAHGPGWGRGGHMMGFWGNESGYGSQYDRGSSPLTEEQRTRLDEARKNNPDAPYERGYGRDYGPPMRGYGPGMGYGRNTGGYGRGRCWN